MARTIATLLDESFDIPDLKGVKVDFAYNFSNDLVFIWMEIGGAICVKIDRTQGSSVAMNREEAIKLANLTMAFVALN